MKSNPCNKKSFSARARAKRVKLFADYLSRLKENNLTVLDIGGTINFWKMNADFIPQNLIKAIDVVNLPPSKQKSMEINGIELNMYEGNALDLKTLRLNHYDIVHSNSVIEHVGNLKQQLIMANSVKKLGRFYWVQTPAKYFPIEPHFYVPFFSYLPLWVRTLLHKNFDLGFMRKEADWLKARIACEQTRLLTKSELRAIFSNYRIIDEKFSFLIKSHIVTNLN